MREFKLFRYALLILAVCLCVPLIGCKAVRGKPKAVAWNLQITKATPATIEVDVIGVTPLDKSSLEGYPVDKYFSANDPRRGLSDPDRIIAVRRRR